MCNTINGPQRRSFHVEELDNGFLVREHNNDKAYYAPSTPSVGAMMQRLLSTPINEEQRVADGAQAEQKNARDDVYGKAAAAAQQAAGQQAESRLHRGKEPSLPEVLELLDRAIIRALARAFVR